VLALVANDSGVINDDIRTGLGAYVQMLRKTKRKTEARELDQQIKNNGSCNTKVFRQRVEL